MNNQDFNNSNDPLNRKRQKDTSSLWIAVSAVILVAVISLFFVNRTILSSGPDTTTATETSAAAPESTAADTSTAATDTNSAGAPVVEPSGGATTDNAAMPSAMSGTPDTSMSAPATTAPMVPSTTATPGTAPSYATEEECKTASNAPCHFVTCDSVPSGKQPDEACGSDFKKGWQPLAAGTDSSSVPEKMAPPLTGQGNAPVEQPPMTGQ